MNSAQPSLKILLLTHSFNGLSQRLFVELREAGHQVSVELDIHDSVTTEAVALFEPDLLIAPFLKRAIPETIWGQRPCLILHPGPPGDRGPSALDWAILNSASEWGVTLLQANEIMDGGDVWGYERFPMRSAAKGSLYRQEVTEVACRVTLQAVATFIEGHLEPTPQTAIADSAQQRAQPLVKQADRAIDWSSDSQQTILRKIQSADGFPGLLDTLYDRKLYLYNAHPEPHLNGKPGNVLGQCDPALCIATADNKAVWIGTVRDKQSAHPFKLPATEVLQQELSKVPVIEQGYSEIRYQEIGGIGLLQFEFYNGAMSTERCHHLQRALQQAKQQNTQAILLLGGEEYWSNGMDLNQIEAADSPADASWENINAMDDLALEIINSDRQLIISALQGNAGAGGVFLARAADLLWVRSGVVLNPHYKDMGNLYGSEYWSYLLPRHCGAENAEQITQSRLPMGSREATDLGLADACFDLPRNQFISHCIEQAEQLNFPQLMEKKQKQRASDEAKRPLASYRTAELERMRMNFYGFDPSYHIARYNFVHKVPKSRTPLTLALHRRRGTQ